VPFDWHEFSTLAGRLASDTNYHQEARLRVATSRYYYSAYWKVRPIVERAPFTPIPRDAKDAHREVVRRCKNSVNPRLKEVGQHLDRMLYVRVWADYRDVPPFHDVDLGNVCRYFTAICSGVSALNVEHTRT
jgi:hypothetical protein